MSEKPDNPSAEVVKPSLHEIAAMPFPSSINAMREHYNSDWGKPIPDGAEKRSFKVRVEYSVRETDTETFTVEAFSEEEACDLACEKFDKNAPYDAEIENVEAKEVGSEQ